MSACRLRRALFGADQLGDPCGERLFGSLVADPAPLPLSKAIRDTRDRLRRFVDHYGHHERLIVGHVERALYSQVPLATEISFAARVRVSRDDRNEQRAVLDLLADRCIPGISPAQLTLVEPNLDSGCTQRSTEARCGIRVLRGVAQEDCLGGLAHWRQVSRGLFVNATRGRIVERSCPSPSSSAAHLPASMRRSCAWKSTWAAGCRARTSSAFPRRKCVKRATVCGRRCGTPASTPPPAASR